MHRLTPRRIAGAIVLVIIILAASACGGGPSGAQKSESVVQQTNYEKLVSQEPSHTMGYSPTRDTINFWIDTWSKPGKLAYVYLQGQNGTLIGYYILKGLPVSYCASQTPTYKFVNPGGSDDNRSNVVVPAPSIDGVYYSGGQCNQYYGKDASNNAYIEFTLGNAMGVLVYDRPLPRQDVKPLGFATPENVK